MGRMNNGGRLTLPGLDQVAGDARYVGQALMDAGDTGERFGTNDAGDSEWQDAETVNVREYRIAGDGTDETAKLQSLVDAIRTRTQRRVRVYFPMPPDRYAVTDAITPNAGGMRFEGESRETGIEQQTPDTPVFRWDGAPEGNRDNVQFARLTLTHANAPTAVTTQQYGIQIRSGVAGTDSYSWNSWLFDDLQVENTYVGIGTWADSGGVAALWASHWRDILFLSTIHNVIKLNNDPSTSILGQPHNTFDHIDVLNYNPAIINDGAVFNIEAGTGAVFNHINVEDWHDRQLTFSGGTYAVINGWRTERSRFDSAFASIFYLANGQFVFNGVDFGLSRVNHPSGLVRIIHADGGAHVVINGFTGYRDAANSTTSNTVAMLWAPAGTAVYADAITPGSGFSSHLPSAYGDGQYGIRRYNGRPPAWDVLPTAGVGYDGQLARVKGPPDSLNYCDDAGAGYAWRTI